MKKMLLLLLILASSLSSLFAQKSVLVSDSTYFLEFNSDTLSLSEWTQYFYSSNCLDSITQHLYLFNPLDTTQQINDYYPNNSLYHTINQTWDTTAHAYVNQSRATYYYNDSSKNLKTINETWVNNSWQPSGLDTYLYDSRGNLDTLLSQYWNGTLQIYINQSQAVYLYDKYGNHSFDSYQSWNADSSRNWQPFFAVTFLYNASGFLLESSDSSEDFFTNTYGLLQHNVYYPDSLNRIDSFYIANYEFGDSSKNYYTYYSSSSKLSQVITYNYQFSGASSGNNISLYYYDSTGNMFNDSIVNKSFISTPDNAYVSATTLSQETRNASGQRLTYYSTTTATDGSVYTTDESYNEYGQQTHYLNTTYYNNKLKNGREDRYHYTLCSSSALPFTLLNFTGQQKNKDALLQWQTSNEINTAYFSLQRSTDGVHFTTIYKAMASGNSFALKSYDYTDANINLLNTAKLYYRLAETDNNGTITYSKTVTLSIANGRLSIAIAPNPVQNTIYLYSPVSIANAQIKITDMNGSVLYTASQNITAGARFGIDASRFAKGMYLVTVQSQTDKQVFKLIK